MGRVHLRILTVAAASSWGEGVSSLDQHGLVRRWGASDSFARQFQPGG